MNDGELLLARDPVLQRGVWVRVVPHGAAAVATSNRDLGRPGRLRWLLGRRTAEKNWDAYEAPDGDRFLSLCERPQEWSVIRHWIAGLAVEIAAAEQDGTLRPLRLEPLNIGALGALMVLLLLTASALVSVVLQMILRGSVLLRLAGVAIVTGRGLPASRLRLLWRALIAWAPLAAVWLTILIGTIPVGSRASMVMVLAAAMALVAGAAWAVARPERGLHDRLAGVWLVPASNAVSFHQPRGRYESVSTSRCRRHSLRTPAGAAVLAMLLPARRAAAIDPLVVLKE